MVNELYDSTRDPHNYNEKYYSQQVKEIAAVTAIAMLRDNVPPADVKTCINDWYRVEISDHAMAYLKTEAADDEADEALTCNRRSILCPSIRRDRCHCARKAKRLCECGVSPDTIYYAFPELSEEEISNICSSANNSNGTRVDGLTLRKLQEATAAPLKTTGEHVAYLRGRSDKAREVIQDLYCNHGGNAHSIYDFFQDDVIKYEEIVGWKQEAADYMERHLASQLARHAAVQMLQDGQEPNRVKENIESWFSVHFSDTQIVTLRRQANLSKCMSEMTVVLDKKED